MTGHHAHHVRRKRSLIGLLLSLTLAAGILLRLSLGGITAQDDIHAFRSWMESAVTLGISESYVRQVRTPWTPVYPPVGIYLLEGSGHLYKALIGPEFVVEKPAFTIFTKLPSMMADMATALIFFLLFARFRMPRRGAAAAAVYAFHPAVLYDSTLWGQMDPVYTLFLVASLALILTGWSTWGAVAFLLACLSKQQTLAFLPLILVMMPWKLRPLLRALGACILVAVLVHVQFLIGGTLGRVLGVFDVMGVLGQSRLSWNAYNGWWLLYGRGAWDIQSTLPLLGPLTYRHVGGIAFLGVYALALMAAWKSKFGPDAERLRAAFLAGTLVTLGLFVCGPEMHERYLFPVLALALPLALTRWTDAGLYALVSGAFLLNLSSVFPYGWLAWTPSPLNPATRWIAAAVTVSLPGFMARFFSVWRPHELRAAWRALLHRMGRRRHHSHGHAV